MKKRMTGFISLLVLLVSYVIIRYALFSLHGMKEWPTLLFLVGAGITVASGLGFADRYLPGFTALGYAGGFVLGWVFQSDSGRGINTLWMIWTCCYAAALAAGLVLSFFSRVRKKGCDCRS